MTEDHIETLGLTTSIVANHVSNNPVPIDEMPTLIASVYHALRALRHTQTERSSSPEPAVPIRSSVKPDYLICLEDGARLKMLKRYLAAHFGMSPADYRQKWGLPPDYPMVAPNYAARRKELAHQSGLGYHPKRKKH